MSDIGFTKMYGVATNGDLVILEPKHPIRLKKEEPPIIPDNWFPRKKFTIKQEYFVLNGTIEQYYIVEKGAELFNQSASKLIDKEIEKLKSLNQIIQGTHPHQGE